MLYCGHARHVLLIHRRLLRFVEPPVERVRNVKAEAPQRGLRHLGLHVHRPRVPSDVVSRDCCLDRCDQLGAHLLSMSPTCKLTRTRQAAARVCRGSEALGVTVPLERLLPLARAGVL